MEDSERRILYLCYYSGVPTGGIKKVYEHVDYLVGMGLNAYVVHNEAEYRYDWYQRASGIPILYMDAVDNPLIQIDAEGKRTAFPPFSQYDILVVPEPWAYKTYAYIEYHQLFGVVFNQNAYYTFRELHHSIQPFAASREESRVIPYLSPQNLGTLVVSQENKEYLTFAFPQMQCAVIRLSCNQKRFYFDAKNKKKQIAYMPRKCKLDALQVVEILRVRDQLQDWEFVPIDNQPEEEVAKIMRESALFMSFSHREGFGLPPMEAMASGCIVIGYHGQAGKEFLKEPYGYPITEGDLKTFIETVERVAHTWETQPEKSLQQAKSAADFIHSRYTQQNEKEDLHLAWQQILKKHSHALSFV